MEAILTAGAVGKMMTGEVTSEKEMVLVLQLTELKLVQSNVTKSQEQPIKERFRMLLSDGTHIQQGMLGTTQKGLFKSVRLYASLNSSVMSSRTAIAEMNGDRPVEDAHYTESDFPYPATRSYMDFYGGALQEPLNYAHFGTMHL